MHIADAAEAITTGMGWAGQVEEQGVLGEEIRMVHLPTQRWVGITRAEQAVDLCAGRVESDGGYGATLVHHPSETTTDDRVVAGVRAMWEWLDVAEDTTDDGPIETGAPWVSWAADLLMAYPPGAGTPHLPGGPITLTVLAGALQAAAAAHGVPVTAPAAGSPPAVPLQVISDRLQHAANRLADGAVPDMPTVNTTPVVAIRTAAAGPDAEHRETVRTALRLAAEAVYTAVSRTPVSGHTSDAATVAEMLTSGRITLATALT